MRRAWVRFGLLIAAIGLLVFLILFQQALQSGLLTSFVGAIRNQSAPVLVYSVDGQRVLQGSVITPDLEQVVRATPGIAEIGLHRAGHVHGHRRRRTGRCHHHRLRTRGRRLAALPDGGANRRAAG